MKTISLLLVLMYALVKVDCEESELTRHSTELSVDEHKTENGDTIYILDKNTRSTFRGPFILCPYIASNIYTDKLQNDVIVSWEPAIAFDLEDGDLSVIQTQGQPPGSRHSEGIHTVTYIARDLHGRSDICSVKFTVTVRRCRYELTYITHGKVLCHPQEDPVIYGSICRYSCDPGYHLTGAKKLTCTVKQDVWNWDKERPLCTALSCGRPEKPEHGNLMCETSEYTYQSRCLVVCDVGYFISEKRNLITCQDDSHWTVPDTCTVTLCPELKAPENSDMICTSGNTYGSVCSVTCHQPFVIKGETTRTCQVDQTWSGEQLVCIGNCSAPPIIMHGRYVCPNGYGYQESCTLICDEEEGYRSEGPLNITCGRNMVWSQIGACIDVEPPRFTEGCPPDMHFTASRLGIPTVVRYKLPGAIDNSGKPVQVEPVDREELSGFDIEDSGTKYVTIKAVDSAGNENTCQFKVTVAAMPCPDPHQGLHETDPIRYACPQGFVDGATCNVSCADGSEPRGAKSVRCGPSGIDDARHWLWEGDIAPYCQEQCSPGQISGTGSQPCQPCPADSYQSEYGMTSCDKCPYSMRTLMTSVKAKSDCIFFEWSPSPTAEIPEPVLRLGDQRPNTFSALIWLRLRATNPRSILHVAFDKEGEARSGIRVALKGTGIVITPQEDLDSRIIRYWYHLALVLDNEGIFRLYLNGEEKDNIKLGLDIVLREGDMFQIQPLNTLKFVGNSLHLFGFQVVTSALNRSQVLDQYNSCHKLLDGNVLSLGSGEYRNIRNTFCFDENDCLGQPCGLHGTCLDKHGSFACLCDKGWFGNLCQRFDYCSNHTCVNGATCLSHLEHSNFTCVCRDGYTGVYCNDKIVDDGWSRWSDWSDCSVACGLGQRSRRRQCDNPRPTNQGQGCQLDEIGLAHQPCFGKTCPVNGGFGEWSPWSQCTLPCDGGKSYRYRNCDNPAPKLNGSDCGGQRQGSLDCNPFRCSDLSLCPPLTKRAGHKSLDCVLTADNTMRDCKVTCKKGLNLVPGTKDNNFRCGLLTNYTWTHQTGRNPNAILPDCAEQKRPTKTRIRLKYGYESLPCSLAPPPENLTIPVKQKILQLIGSGIETSYEAAVKVETTCRETSTGPYIAGRINLMCIFDDFTPSEKLSALTEEERREVMIQVLAVDRIFVQLTTESDDLLKFSQDGTDHMAEIESYEVDAQCPDYPALYDGLCVECPPGSSYLDGLCVWCRKGFYQPNAGMSHCIPCPVCLSTLGDGSYSSENCSIEVCSKPTASPDSASSSGQDLQTILIAVTGPCALLIIISAVIVVIVLRKLRRRAVLNPYDIPEEYRAMDPYLRMGDDPYDQIDEDPYACVQETMLDTGSDGYLLSRDKITTDDDYGVGSVLYNQVDGDTQAKPITDGQTTPKCDSQIKPRSEHALHDSFDVACNEYLLPKHVDYSTDQLKVEVDQGVSRGMVNINEGVLQSNQQPGCNKKKRALPPPGIFDKNINSYPQEPMPCDPKNEDRKKERSESLETGVTKCASRGTNPDSALQNHAAEDISGPESEGYYLKLIQDVEEQPYYTDPDKKQVDKVDLDGIDTQLTPGEVSSNSRKASDYSDKYYLFPSVEEPSSYTNPVNERDVNLDAVDSQQSLPNPTAFSPTAEDNNTQRDSNYSDKYYLFPSIEEQPYYTNPDKKRVDNMELDAVDSQQSLQNPREVSLTAEDNTTQRDSNYSDKYYLFPSVEEQPYHTKFDRGRDDNVDLNTVDSQQCSSNPTKPPMSAEDENNKLNLYGDSDK